MRSLGLLLAGLLSVGSWAEVKDLPQKGVWMGPCATAGSAKTMFVAALFNFDSDPFDVLALREKPISRNSFLASLQQDSDSFSGRSKDIAIYDDVQRAWTKTIRWESDQRELKAKLSEIGEGYPGYRLDISLKSTKPPRDTISSKVCFLYFPLREARATPYFVDRSAQNWDAINQFREIPPPK